VNALVCSQALHNALKADDAAWATLPLVGVQHIDADEDGPAESLELRNCACGSTLCKSIPLADRLWLVTYEVNDSYGDVEEITVPGDDEEDARGVAWFRLDPGTKILKCTEVRS
jgi:hypothetical protein